MASAMKGKAALIAALFLISCVSFFPSCQGGITAINRCSFGLSVFKQDQTGNPRVQFNVAAGKSQDLQIPYAWVGGVIWGSQHGNTNNGQCTQLEFNIDTQRNNRDSYDVSVVNAYNVAARITVTNKPSSGLECGSPICSIPNLNSVCTLKNFFTGPDHACINADGTGKTSTPSTKLFENACPKAYAFSTNDANHVYGCTTGANYNIVFCP